MHPQVETCIEAFNNSGKYLSNHRTYDPNDPSAYYNVQGLTSARVRHFLITFVLKKVQYILR